MNQQIAFIGAVLALEILPLRAAVVLNETFSYINGPLTSVSAEVWSRHSGTLQETQVTDGQLNLSQSHSEDVHALLQGQPYAQDATNVLWARFSVRFTGLPSGNNGTYFAHFMDAATGFRCRLFAATNGAAAGFYRLGIASATNSAATFFPRDLSLSMPYTVVTRLALNNAASTLWIDPVSPADQSVTAVDAGSPITVAAYAFRQSLSSGLGMGKLLVDDLLVATSFDDILEVYPPADLGPQLTQIPANQTVTEGSEVILQVVAYGTEPLSYQWTFNGAMLTLATNSSLTLHQVAADQAGVYQVVVSNRGGSVMSPGITVVVTPPVNAEVSTIASLRAGVDSVNYLPSDTTSLFTVEGVVTTHTNLAGGTNVLCYLQDATAGLAVFWKGGASQFIPQAGDRLRVTAPLTHSNGLLELAPQLGVLDHRVQRIATHQPLPAPVSLEFHWQHQPELIEPLEGQYLVASNVFLDLTPPVFPSAPSGGTVTMTNANGETFVLRVAGTVDFAGQTKPDSAVTIFGVLGQSDASDPRTSGYQLIPTRVADIVGLAPSPTIRFTNVLANLVIPGDLPTNQFNELVLRPGETITTQIAASSPEGSLIRLTVLPEGQPPGIQWTLESPGGSAGYPSFTYRADSTDAGQLFAVRLQADNGAASTLAVWTIYVPTVIEQKIVLTEMLANPTANMAALHFNPLRREPPSPNPSVEDEFIELVNFSDAAVDLAGWSIADAVQVRHRFPAPFPVASSNAVVVYGGPRDGFRPNLDARAIPASESGAGLALNNSGTETILVRNTGGNLVLRLVYTGDLLSGNGSLSRFPSPAGPLVPQLSISTSATSPGRQYDGRSFDQPPVSLGSVQPVKLLVTSNGAAILQWDAATNCPYTVWQANAMNEPFTVLRHELRFTNAAGQFLDLTATNASQRFYWISTP